MNRIGITGRACLWAALVLAPSVAPAQDYDAAWTFGNVGNESYRLDAFEPNDSDLGELGTEDPNLPLQLGNRYQVTVTNYTFHPLEIIAKGASAPNDDVLLSMSVDGPFESDPNVAWEDDGQGTVAFTLTEALYQAMTEEGRTPGYRCQLHATTMRGDFTVSGIPIADRIEPSPVRVALETVASGLTSPVLLVSDANDPNRHYAVEQTGPIYVIDSNGLAEEPFLDVSGLLVSLNANYDERGLLGLAFHPGYADASSPGYGLLYTYTSEPVDGPADFTLEMPAGEEMNHQSVIREWIWADANLPVDPEASREVVRLDQPQSNHNAGQMTFGPDGYLYVALGDGGGANDTGPGHGAEGNGQNLNTIHGSIIRIDPIAPDLTPDSNDGPSGNGAYRVPADNPFVGVEGLDEIYAYGFRNPYRFSFDQQSGALIVADVGQNRIEEVDLVERGGNYGWNIKEGSYLFDPNTGEIGPSVGGPNLIDPVAEYDHDEGIAVVGGYVYYGTEIPELWGRYVFGDFSQSSDSANGRLFVADLFTGEIQELLVGPLGDPLGRSMKGFGQGTDGEIYVLASDEHGPSGDSGVVLKLTAAPTEFTADLTGAGAGTDDPATGQTRFTIDPNTNTFSFVLDVNAIQDVTQAHIHVADEPNGDGPPAVWLYPSNPPAQTMPGEFTGELGAGPITDANLVGPLAGLTLNDLFTAIREIRAYVNVHTEANPAGAIRGPVQPVQAEVPIGAVLTGGPAATDSTATGLTILRPGPEDTWSYELKVHGLKNVTQAHIHVAEEPGGNGPPAVWLYPAAPPAELIPGRFTGKLGAGEITAAALVGPLEEMTLADLLTAIEENRAYVNVHTEQFPAGEIRGTLR